VTEVERLTPEQLALWDEVGMDRPILPTAHQTREQAVNFAVADFRYVCGFDGVDVPSEAAVRAELAFGMSGCWIPPKRPSARRRSRKRRANGCQKAGTSNASAAHRFTPCTSMLVDATARRPLHRCAGVARQRRGEPAEHRREATWHRAANERLREQRNSDAAIVHAPPGVRSGRG